MRRAPLLALAALIVVAAPAGAAKKPKGTSTPVRLESPAPANVTVAGFELDLVKVKKKKAHGTTAAATLARVGAALPKHVTVYGVVAKQKRSDRVRGVLVAANRAASVNTGSPRRTASRRLTVNLKHGAVPKGFKLKLKLAESDNVLGRHRAFLCSKYFKSSDLAGAQRLGGPGLPNITIGTVIQSACRSASTRTPYAALGELLGALNAPSGKLTFVRDAQVPGQLDGSATFNYPVKAFSVSADKAHSFASCGFAGGACAVGSSARPGDSALVTLATPAPAGTPLPFTLTVTPSITKAVPFEFTGIDQAGHRQTALPTSGPSS
jgi:hypothetical protein